MNTIENAKEIISSYKRDDGKKLRIMEVCGTHTHEIFRLGIRKLLPESVELISGPGCPVRYPHWLYRRGLYARP